jgi:hypothetical protein
MGFDTLFVLLQKKSQILTKMTKFNKFGDLGRVRILIKTRLKVKFDIFSIVNLSNFTFNRFLMSIRTRPYVKMLLKILIFLNLQ